MHIQNFVVSGQKFAERAINRCRRVTFPIFIYLFIYLFINHTVRKVNKK